MLTPDDICLAAEETCQSGAFVHLVALRLEETSEDFSVADLIGRVTLVVETHRESSSN